MTAHTDHTRREAIEVIIAAIIIIAGIAVFDWAVITAVTQLEAPAVVQTTGK